MAKVLLIMVIALLLSGCLTSQPEPSQVKVIQEPEPGPTPNLELLKVVSQINSLQEEIKFLRGAVEEMQFNQDNVTRRSNDQLQDIDRRLLGLEQFDQKVQAQSQGRPEVALSPSEQILAEGQLEEQRVSQSIGQESSAARWQGESGSDKTITEGVSRVTVVDSVTVSSTANSTTTQRPSVNTETVADSVSLNEQDAFDDAINVMNQGRYQDAIDQFQALVTSWPNSDLADDALYYMSEAHLVNREFELALNGFRGVIERYPNSSRVPKSMLRVGTIQYDIGAYKDAAETLQTVLARFPGNEVTVQAQTRLRRIQQTIGE